MKNRVYDQYSEEAGTRPSTADDQNWNRGYAAAEALGGQGVAMPVRPGPVREYIPPQRAVSDDRSLRSAGGAGATSAVVAASTIAEEEQPIEYQQSVEYSTLSEAREPRETTLV